jgi:hypothetical protein
MKNFELQKFYPDVDSAGGGSDDDLVKKNEKPDEQRHFYQLHDVDESRPPVRREFPHIINLPKGICERGDEVTWESNLSKTSCSFEQFLSLFGANYEDYLEIFRRKENRYLSQLAIIKKLYEEILSGEIRLARQHREKKIEQEGRWGGDVRDMYFFVKMINDLHISGLHCEPADGLDDDRQQVDEFLSLYSLPRRNDDDEHDRDESKIFIGLQRSFREKSFNRSVGGRRPLQRAEFMRSDLLKGVVFKVMIHELSSLGMYHDGSKVHYWDKLQPKSAKLSGGVRAPMPNVDTVLPGGKHEHLSRVRNILKKIKQQFEEYIKSEEFTDLDPLVQREIQKISEPLNSDIYNYVKNIDEKISNLGK